MLGNTALQFYILVLLVMRFVSVYNNIKQKRTMEERNVGEHDLIKRAYYNPITELPNLSNVKMVIDEQMNRTTRHKRNFLLAVIKIQNYHDVNMHSTEYGKTFIIEAANRIVDALRTEDVVAHTTDNGFVILFNEYLEKENYNILVERLNNSFAEKLKINSSTFFDFKISIGTVTSSELYTTSEALINEATRQALKNL